MFYLERELKLFWGFSGGLFDGTAASRTRCSSNRPASSLHGDVTVQRLEENISPPRL